MHKQTQSRTVVAIVMLIALILLNTTLGAGYQLYNVWFAWTVYGTAVVLLLAVFRFQQQLSAWTIAALLTLPFLIAIVGALF